MDVKFTPNDPPRRFRVGQRGEIELKDCGRIELEPDEQVTFVTPDGKEYDVVRKSWGFYATPSLEGRLARFGLRAVLVDDARGKHFVHLVERGKEAEHEAYLREHRHRIVAWLDSAEVAALRRLP